MSSGSNTYKSNKELGLNANGVRVPFQNRGPIKPSAPGSPHHVACNGGHIRPTAKQTGWRVRCAQIGTCGGFELTVGANIYRYVLPGMVDQVDFTVDEVAPIRVEHIGMLSQDWGALVITRVF